jgi:hypothetical protein
MVGNMDGVGGPTIRSGCLPISGYTPHVHSAGGGKGIHLAESTLHAVEMDTLTHIHVARSGMENTNVHTLACRQGYTRTSTLCNIDKDTPSPPHSLLWKGIQPHFHTAGGGKRCTFKITLWSGTGGHRVVRHCPACCFLVTISAARL